MTQMISSSRIPSFERKQHLLLHTFAEKQSKMRLYGSSSSIATIEELRRKPRSLRQTRVYCCNTVGYDNSIASIMSNKEIILLQARLQFCEEISFAKQDQDVSPVKALLLISAEDESFVSLNKEKDRLAAHTEGRNFSGIPSNQVYKDDVNDFPIAGRTMPMWFARFDFLVKEVTDILASKRGEGPTTHVNILKTVSSVLFGIQKFKQSVANVDARSYYIHLVMTLGSGSGLLLSIIYMEICKRLGVTIKAAEIGDELFMWPMIENLYECFEPSSSGGKSWFSEMLAFQHQSHLSRNIGALTDGYTSTSSLKFASNRDLVGMVLANLKNNHWKDACKAQPGFALTDPLLPLVYSELSVGTLLRPRNLRLALMASERLLLLQPHNWVLRRDHGLLLYHSRRYGEAVQELSICTAFAPTLEAQTLEHFIEKLHLLRIESSWTSIRSGAPSTLA